jgi:hypothetical protein
VANGRPRDELRNDIEAGRPGVAQDVDQLALRCAQPLDRKRSEWFWNSIEYRIRLPAPGAPGQISRRRNYRILILRLPRGSAGMCHVHSGEGEVRRIESRVGDP